MNDFELGFIIGLIEGEGNISLGRGVCKNPQGFSLHPRFAITNTDKRLLLKAQSIIGGIIIKQEKTKSPIHKNKFILMINGQKLKLFLPLICSYLITKKQQCRLLMKYLNIHKRNGRNGYPPREQKIFEKIKKLNKRGIAIGY